ncbi:adenosylcobinamide-GDP ribazoletransferase [Niallia endozanthoxylica]|uniref:Adenosylcobinamide-GDP ribazoletransferase n=1 Tax=Niallia endozanthoxylica TaxID=2036016 RepID=A0A5J5H8U0_9BACI|nr:adenosylcobinamide-GDP ribazoletransferase [Niallia endozanthoxylica]KAA9017085.1 adenosylcobinamide-GDP ribazoletransferase [Niallia endozanthoxylica]
MKTIKGLIMAFQFFTSIPIPYEVPMDRVHIEKAIKTFPILGLLQGIFYAFVLFAISAWTPLSPLAAAFFVWLSMILLTGGLHLDGWMDASDAYFSYRDRERRLEIMKDSRVGAFGVLSIVVLLSAKFLFIYEIAQRLYDASYVLIAFIPFLSKSVMGVLLIYVKAAKKEGLGTLFKNAASKYTLWIYPIYIIILFVVLLAIWPGALGGAFLLLLAGVVFIMISAKKAVKWFGGITGDVLGASVEGVEMVLWMTLWLWHYFVTV